MANTGWMLNAFGKPAAKSILPDVKQVKEAKMRKSSKVLEPSNVLESPQAPKAPESPKVSELEHPQFQPSLDQLKLMLSPDNSKKNLPKG